MQLPEAFVARMRSMLGEEADTFLTALVTPEEGLRVNTLRLSGREFSQISAFPLRALDFTPDAFLVEGSARPGKHPYHAAGLYYLQDPGATAVGLMVSPRPGERVLDLSAAPGGKSTHLAALMEGKGLLVANDVNAARAAELVGNIERCGVRNAIVTSERVGRLAAHFGPYFDRVLVDAPCSGESMFHKSAAAREDWSEAAVRGCAVRQKDLLGEAASLVRPGGELFYSTCTFSPEENEEVVGTFLDRNPDFRLGELPRLPGAEPAAIAATADTALRASGAETGRGQQPGISSPTAYRLWPHRFPGAGHFVAALRRSEDGDSSGELRPRQGVSPEAQRFFREFLRQAIPDYPLDDERLALYGEALYELPEDAPDTRGLRVLRSGLHLGAILSNRFETGHALALALDRNDSAKRVDLDADDPRVKRFLQGHPIDSVGDPGWAAVCVDGFALGWGKRVGGTVKNHYPKGLRWRD